VNGIFTAVIAGGIMLALAGLAPIDQVLTLFLFGGAAKLMGRID